VPYLSIILADVIYICQYYLNAKREKAEGQTSRKICPSWERPRLWRAHNTPASVVAYCDYTIFGNAVDQQTCWQQQSVV